MPKPQEEYSYISSGSKEMNVDGVLPVCNDHIYIEKEAMEHTTVRSTSVIKGGEQKPS